MVENILVIGAWIGFQIVWVFLGFGSEVTVAFVGEVSRLVGLELGSFVVGEDFVVVVFCLAE